MSDNALTIDIPVKLERVKSVHSIGSLQFEGDLPASIFHLQLITGDIAAWGAESDVIAVFHTNAGHVTLNDGAYNASRNIATGNPYRDVVAGLIASGVRVELCGATACANGWGNADLLPDIKINLDAMARTIELVQQDFVKISDDPRSFRSRRAGPPCEGPLLPLLGYQAVGRLRGPPLGRLAGQGAGA
jgi:hypothetical protein